MIKKFEVVNNDNANQFEYEVEKVIDTMQKNGLVVSIQCTTVTDEDGEMILHTAYITGKEKSKSFELLINE